MKRKQFMEVYDHPAKLEEQTSETGEKKYIISGSFMSAGKPNCNGRIYPVEVCNNTIGKLRPKVEQRRIKVGLDHPDFPSSSKLANTAAILLDITDIQEDGYAYYKAQIIDTEAGKTLKIILDAGALVGVSTRGYGSSKVDNFPGVEGKYEIIGNDYVLKGFEFVDDPSVEETEETMHLENQKRSPDMKTIQEIKEAYPEIMTAYEQEHDAKVKGFEKTIEELSEQVKTSTEKLTKVISSLKENFEPMFTVVPESQIVSEKVAEIETKNATIKTMAATNEELQTKLEAIKAETVKLEKEKEIEKLKAEDSDYFKYETMVKNFENCVTAEEIRKVYESGKAIIESVKKENTAADPKTRADAPKDKLTEDMKADLAIKNQQRKSCGLPEFTVEQYQKFAKTNS
jgi:hypothetical protein